MKEEMLKEELLTENPSADQLHGLHAVFDSLDSTATEKLRNTNLQLARERRDKEIGTPVIERNISAAIIHEIHGNYRSSDFDHRHHQMISLILAGVADALFAVSLHTELTEYVIENIETDIDAMKEGLVRNIRSHLECDIPF